MTDDVRERVEDLFRQALALSPGRWPAFLSEACWDDPRVRAAVEDRLADWAEDTPDEEDTFLLGPIHMARGGGPPDIPGYRLLRPIGHGGMGSVYEAEQHAPRRRVAVKVVRPELLSAELDRRFRVEAEVLGRLRHPGIAQIFEAGRTANGRPYIVMEYVVGVPLNEFLRAHPLPAAGRVELLAQVCEAMHHAHTRGVIHRDLKPANILVDDSGRPRVLDFGIARTLGPASPSLGSHTQAGQVLGTLAYMSPEQMSAAPVDERADVYSLGVILYELLADRPPFDVSHLHLPEVARVICEREPAKLGAIDRRLAGDLEVITAKAMSKEPADRYRSALNLADELRRHLAHEPILARPPSAFGRLSRWCRRSPRRAAIAGVATVALLLLAAGGATAAAVFADQAGRQQQLTAVAEAARRTAEQDRERAELAEGKARAESDQATAVTTFLRGLFEPTDRIRFGTLCLDVRDPAQAGIDDLLRRGVAKLNSAGGFRDRPLVRAELLHAIGSAYFTIGRVKEAAPLLDEALALRRRLLPPAHPELGRTVFVVAQVRSLAADEVDQELFREAAEISTAAHDPDGLNRADVEASLALFTWYLNGDSVAAAPALSRACDVYRRELGGGDPRALTTLLVLAYLHVSEDRAAATMPYLRDLFAQLEGSDSHAGLLSCCRHMMSVYASVALLGRAPVTTVRRTYDDFARTFGEHHFFTVHARAMAADHAADGDERTALLRGCLRSLDTWGVPSTYLRAKYTFEIARTATDWATEVQELRAAIALFRTLAPKASQGRADYPHALQRLARRLAAGDDEKSADEVGELLEEGRAYCQGNERVPAYRRAFAFSDSGHWRLQHGDAGGAAESLTVAVTLWRADPRPVARKFLAESLALLAFAVRAQGDGRRADTLAGEAQKLFDAERHKTDESLIRTRELLAGRLPAWR